MLAPREDVADAMASPNDVVDVTSPLDGEDVTSPLDREDVLPEAAMEGGADVLPACPDRQTRCGDACVNLQSDPMHCGRCGNACAAGQVCMAGACVTECRAPNMMCGSACVNAQTDPMHCGACGRTCPGTVNGMPACMGGNCTVACNMGFTACGSACVNLQSDPMHCGRCGNACAAGQACMAGACVSECREPNRMCGSMCVNVQTDPNHCGACNMRCTAPTGGSTTCEGGMCRPSCTGSTQIVCGGACVDAQSSTTHCGRCGNACPTPANGTAVCTSGTCGVGTCNPGFANCDGNAANGCETNLNDSTAHCGRCGNACPTPANGTAACTSGTCSIGTCNPGFGNCDGNAANGCETNLNNTVAHCGRCGNTCPTPANGTATCTSGTCGVGTCNPGFANCDGNAANGCETNLNDSTTHCGRCGNSCGPGVVCTAGICGSGSVRAGSGELGYVQVDPDRDEVYFTQRSPGILFRMRMDGTGLTRFAEFGTGGYGLSGLTLTSEAVYVSTYDNYSIERVARVTGAITRVTSTSFQAAGLDHDGTQLWMTDWSGSIHRRPLSGGAITTFATGLPSRLFGLFLGTGPDDRIYLTAGHSGARDAGEIFSLDRAGGDRRRLASLLSYPTQVTADERHVYAANYYGHRGSIARAPRATLEGGARFIGGATGAIGVTVAANRLYWTTTPSASEVRWMGLTPTCPARWAVETTGTNVTLSNGNRTVSGTAPSCAGGVLGSDWRTTGRYYFEHVAVRDGGTSDARCPVAVGVSSADGEKAAIWYGYLGNTSYLSRGSVTCTAAGPPTVYVDSGDVMGVAWDASARMVRFYRNGTLAFSCTLPEGVYYPVANHCNDATYHCAGTTNFGEAPFRHAPPSGFGPLCAP